MDKIFPAPIPVSKLTPINYTIILNDLRELILKEYLKQVEWKVNPDWAIKLKNASGAVLSDKIGFKSLSANETAIEYDAKPLTETIEIVVGDLTIGTISVKNGLVK